jgi:hypothetical protein
MEAEGISPDHTTFGKLIKKWSQLAQIAPADRRERGESSSPYTAPTTSTDGFTEDGVLYAEDADGTSEGEGGEGVYSKGRCRMEADRLFIEMTNRGEAKREATRIKSHHWESGH